MFHGGKSTGPITLNGKRRCAEAKTIHGLSTEYFENEILKSNINWVEGKIKDLNEEYFENGQLSIRVRYYNGKKDKTIERYNKDGSVIKFEKYNNGELIKAK